MCSDVEEKNNVKKIYLTLINGTGYVFDVNDYMTLRQNHRIVGALVGTASYKGWSANERTLPAALTECETRLLLERGIVDLVSKSDSLLKQPTELELTEYKQELEERLRAQSDALKSEKMREAERNMDRILAGKRRNLLKKGMDQEAANLSPADLLQEIVNNYCFEPKNALVDVPCAHPTTHTARIVATLPAPHNALKYYVYRDLWLRGKFVTSGDNFGADFLVYPGDPLIYHASHIVILQDKPSIRALDLIAKVRLAVIVNKICVLAYFAKAPEDNEVPKICYQTVNWLGNDNKKV